MKRVVCFGDSNTYGYDPRGFPGGRYPAEIRWTDRLAASTGWEVRNLGQNGRTIPRLPPWELLAEDADAWTVMLGSNDLLCGAALTAEDAGARMAAFLARLPADRLLLIAPPPMRLGAWVEEERLLVQSARLGGCYAAAARSLGTAFADAGAWGVSLAFDGVHFSEEGHRRFAAGVEAALAPLVGR